MRYAAHGKGRCEMNPHVYGAGTRLSSLYTMGFDGKPFPKYGGNKTSAGFKAWQKGKFDRLEVKKQGGVR